MLGTEAAEIGLATRAVPADKLDITIEATIERLQQQSPAALAIAKKAHLGGAFQWTWGILRWPVAFTAILLFFALAYYLAPNKEPRSWKWITPGSLIGGLLWLALSGLFALYVTFAGNYTKTYGTIASGIILLLWLNYSAFALLYGAELNSELERQADMRAGGGEQAGLVKPARRT